MNKLSGTTIDAIAKVITGDRGSLAPYRGVKKLVSFFNSFFDVSDTYDRPDFPARLRYATEKLQELNGSEKILRALEEALDPIHFDDQCRLEIVIEDMRKHLRKDGYEVVQAPPSSSGTFYRIRPMQDRLVNVKNAPIDHEFIVEQIEKAEEKITSGDFDGAITNARSLVEATQEHVIVSLGHPIPDHKGDLGVLFKTVKGLLRLDPAKDMEEVFKQVLSGLNSINCGLAGLSNRMGDRHARKYKPERRHAKLAVNSAYTFCDFLLDCLDFHLNLKSKMSL